MEVVVITGAIRRAKLQSNRHHQQTNIQLFTGRMPFLSSNQQCQSIEGKISHSMDLLTPSSPGVFQLCLWPLIAPGYLGGGLPCLSSALWCQYPRWFDTLNKISNVLHLWSYLISIILTWTKTPIHTQCWMMSNKLLWQKFMTLYCMCIVVLRV